MLEVQEEVVSELGGGGWGGLKRSRRLTLCTQHQHVHGHREPHYHDGGGWVAGALKTCVLCAKDEDEE